MNKAVGMARGEWINFMNCGDMFARDTVLENIFSKEIPDSISFLYSDYLIKTKHRTLRYTASFERGVLLHQSVIYRKSLHERFGFYLITPKIIISDYLFFCLVSSRRGVQSERNHFGKRRLRSLFRKVAYGTEIMCRCLSAGYP